MRFKDFGIFIFHFLNIYWFSKIHILVKCRYVDFFILDFGGVGLKFLTKKVSLN